MTGHNWQQGSLFLLNESQSTLASKWKELGDAVVLISHDCDISRCRDGIDTAEVIVGKVVPSVNGSFTNAKNPRKIHLEYNHEMVIELEQKNKRFLKSVGDLEGFCTPLPPSSENKKALKQWLAIRYGRPAFPDAFEERLRKGKSRKKTIEKVISEQIGKVSDYVNHVLIHMGEERFRELEKSEPYYISIVLVCNDEEHGFDCVSKVQKIADEITQEFSAVFGEPEDDGEDKIVLDNCEAKSEFAVTFNELRKGDVWRLDYISLKNNEDCMSTAEREW